MEPILSSPWPISDLVSRRGYGSGSSSPSFGRIPPAPGNWGVSAWGWPWSGPLQKSTAAAYGWRKIRLAGIDFWSGFRQYVYEGEPSGHRKACYAIDNLNNFHLFFAILLRLICFPPRFNCNTFMCSERVYGNFCGQKTAWSWPVSCGNARSTPPLFTLRIIPVSRWTASLSPH